MADRDRYRLSLLPSNVGSPLLRLVHTPFHSLKSIIDETATTDAIEKSIVFDETPPTNMAWTDDGLVFWSNPSTTVEEEEEGEGQKAKLCRVSGYRWVPRENEWKVDKVIEVRGVVGKEKEKEGEAMEVDA